MMTGSAIPRILMVLIKATEQHFAEVFSWFCTKVIESEEE